MDRTRRAFAGGDEEAALTEALRARQLLPSPAQVAALGKELGARGEEVAKRIEQLRRKLDSAMSKLDQAGAGDAPNRVDIPNLTIE